jgi:hypothetical protein
VKTFFFCPRRGFFILGIANALRGTMGAFDRDSGVHHHARTKTNGRPIPVRLNGNRPTATQSGTTDSDGKRGISKYVLPDNFLGIAIESESCDCSIAAGEWSPGRTGDRVPNRKKDVRTRFRKEHT